MEGNLSELFKALTLTDIQASQSDYEKLSAAREKGVNEFLSTLSETFANTKGNDKALLNTDNIVPILLQSLANETNYQDKNIINAIEDCLFAIYNCSSSKFTENTTGFAEESLYSDNPFKLRAGLFVYSCLLRDPANESLRTQILPKVVSLIEGSSLLVQEEAAFVLERIAEEDVRLFFEEPYTSQLLSLVTRLIESNSKISVHIINIWNYLGQHIQKESLDYDVKTIIDLLLKNLLIPKENEQETQTVLISPTFQTIFTLTQSLLDRTSRLQYITKFVSLFKELANYTDKAVRDPIQKGILSCLESLLSYFSLSDLEDNEELIQDLLSTVSDWFGSHGNRVDEAGMGILNALVSAIKPVDKTYAKKIWLYVIKGLQQVNNSGLFLATAHTVLELITDASFEEIAGYLPHIIQTLIDVFNQKEVDNLLRLNALSSIADLALNIRELILPYLQSLLNIFEKQMDISLVLAFNEDKEAVEYAEKLRDNIIEAFSCIMQASEDLSTNEQIQAFSPKLVEFLVKTTSSEFKPTVEYKRGALGLLADFGMSFGFNEDQPEAKILMVKLVKELGSLEPSPENKQTIEYAKNVLINM